MIADLKTSDEYHMRVEQSTISLPDVYATAPDRYVDLVDDDGHPVRTFIAEAPDAFDWIEHAILENGFYEKPGVWVLSIDTDKRAHGGDRRPIGARIGARGRLLERRSARGPRRGRRRRVRCRHQHLRPRPRAGHDPRAHPSRRAGRDGVRPHLRRHVRSRHLRAHPSRQARRVHRRARRGHRTRWATCSVNVPAYGTDEVFGEAFPIPLPRVARRAPRRPDVPQHRGR